MQRKMKTSMADVAVCRELLSASNSLMIRENTGNFRDFDSFGDCSHPKKPFLLWSFRRNSLLNVTANFEVLSGNFIAVSGNFQTINRVRVGSTPPPQQQCRSLLKPQNPSVSLRRFSGVSATAHRRADCSFVVSSPAFESRRSPGFAKHERYEYQSLT